MLYAGHVTAEPKLGKNATSTKSVTGHYGVAIGSLIYGLYGIQHCITTTHTQVKHDNMIYPSSMLGIIALFITINAHSYVLGIGENYTEIWVNTVSADLSQWHLVGTLNTTVHGMACLWPHGEIFIVGGAISKMHLL